VGGSAPRGASENDPACAQAFARGIRGFVSYSNRDASGLGARRKEPDAAARAYLRVIAREPDVVRKALNSL